MPFFQSRLTTFWAVLRRKSRRKNSSVESPRSNLLNSLTHNTTTKLQKNIPSQTSKNGRQGVAQHSWGGVTWKNNSAIVAPVPYAQAAAALAVDT